MTASVARWRRYGKDRLYVTGDDGTKLGHRDLLTGEDHIESPARADEFKAAISAWIDTEAMPGPAAPAAAAGAQSPQEPVVAAAIESPELPVLPTQPTREDLAERPAGEMVRQQAAALRQAAPVRTFLARVLGVHTEERAWRIGADGEKKVAAQLEKLARKDPQWRFLHAIPVGERGSDIDHVVIGPGGVFTLNTKHHPGAKIWIGGDTVMVNGQRHPYIQKSRFEAQRASRLLTAACGFPVVAVGVVVPVGADALKIKEPPADVHVVNRMRLAKWLRDRPPVLPPATINAIFDAARRPTTWSAGAQ